MPTSSVSLVNLQHAANFYPQKPKTNCKPENITNESTSQLHEQAKRAESSLSLSLYIYININDSSSSRLANLIELNWIGSDS